MSYAFRAAGTPNIANSNTVTSVGMPAGVVAGDLLLAFLSLATTGSGGTVPTVSTPSGWTQLGSTVINQTTNAGITGAWYYRWATGSDTGPSWTLDPTNVFKHACVVVAYSGGPGVGVPAITTGNGATGSATTTNTAPTINTGTTPTWTVEFYSSRSTTNASYTTPAGTTLRASGFGTGGAAVDVLVVDSGADVTGTDGGDATTAGTSAAWSLNAVIELPPLGVASVGAAALSLSGSASDVLAFPVGAAASLSVTGAATDAAGTTVAAAAITLTAAVTLSPVRVTSLATLTLTGGATPMAPPVGFVASSALVGNSTTASAFTPAGVVAGNLLIAHLTVATGGSGFTQPATPTPTGYTLLGTQTSQSATAGTVGAWYYRWASGSDVSPTIVLHATQVYKWALAVTAHSGADGSSVPQFVAGIDPQNTQTSHTSETMTLPASTWVIESFGIRSTTNGSYTTPAGLTPLAEIFGTGGGAADVAVFDTHADVNGLVGGHTTVSDTASTFGVHATIAIPPKGGHPESGAAVLTLTARAATTITNAASSFGWGFSNDNLSTAEAALGRPVDFLRDYGWLGHLPPVSPLAAQRRVIVSMKFKTDTLPNGVPATDITSHIYDSQIDAWGRWFIGLPQCPAGPHIAVPEHEIDATAAHNSGTDAQLNAAFAYVAARWRALAGWNGLLGTIVTGFNPTTREPLYVADFNISDVVGIDNPYISFPGSSGDQVVGPAVDWFTTNYPTMPLFIGEWGVDPGTGTQRVNAITAFEAALTKTRYAKVFAVCYWDRGGVTLDTAGMAAWAAGGQRAQGPIGGAAAITVTGAVTDKLTFILSSADSAITVTAAANVTSSTGATRPAALVALAAAAAITGPVLVATAGAQAVLSAGVGAPPAFVIDSAIAALTLTAAGVATLTTSDAVTAAALINLLAGAIGPPVVAHVVPVNVRCRITAQGGNFEMDISQFVASVEYTRGRTTALETSVAAATATLVLDDTAGTFDPSNSQSPLFGLLNPGWQSDTTLRVDEFVSALGAYVSLFVGGIESLERTYTGGDLSLTTGVFVDQTFDLSRHIPAAGLILPAELPGARIGRLLTSTSRSGFTFTSRSQSATTTQLDRGQKILSAVTCDGTTTTWDYATQAAAAEGGLLYFDAEGVLTFSGQQDRLTPNIVWHFGDQAAMTPVETDLTYRVSTDDMVLDVAVTTTDTASSSTSTAFYGPGGPSSVAAGVQFNADVTETSALAGWNAGVSRAQYVYATRSVPRQNAPTVTLEATPVIGVWQRAGTPTAYQAAVVARVGDLCRLTRTPTYGDPIVQNYWIEGMHAVIAAAGQWTTTLNISRADPVAAGGYWRLGISRLGINTTLTW